MKVLLLNGSPNEHGCTYTALCEVARALEESGVETETLWIGNSPVHYAAAGGSITSFLDRMFYAGGSQLRTKVGAAVCSARRAGTTSTLDQLSKYFTICGMPIAPSQYWPMVHGNTPEDVLKDEEGLQIMRMLGRNMAYMIRAFALARENGLLPPEMEKPKKRTNFIR